MCETLSNCELVLPIVNGLCGFCVNGHVITRAEGRWFNEG